METEISKENLSKNTRYSSFFLIAQIILRVFATVFAAVAITMMITSNRDIYTPFKIDGKTMYLFFARARYSYSSALSYMLFVDAAVCAFSLLSLVLVYKVVKFAKTDPETSFYFNLLVVDGVMMAMALSGCAAATTMGLLSLKGLNKPGISWAPICRFPPDVNKFCSKVTISIAFSYAGFACLAALTFIAACKLRSLAMN